MSGKASAVSAGRNQMSTKVLGKPNKNSRQKTSSDGYLVHSHRDEKWAVLDSNQRPPRCQRKARDRISKFLLGFRKTVWKSLGS